MAASQILSPVCIFWLISLFQKLRFLRRILFRTCNLRAKSLQNCNVFRIFVPQLQMFMLWCAARTKLSDHRSSELRETLNSTSEPFFTGGTRTPTSPSRCGTSLPSYPKGSSCFLCNPLWSPGVGQRSVPGLVARQGAAPYHRAGDGPRPYDRPTRWAHPGGSPGDCLRGDVVQHLPHGPVIRPRN